MTASRIRSFDPFTCPLEGANLVEASAGTGKTYGLSWIAARFVLERAIPIDGLLAVTFTNAATAELKSAVRERIETALSLLEGGGGTANEREREYAQWLRRSDRAAKLARTALAEFDRAAVSSIHGFCQRVLGERAFESGAPFDPMLLEDDTGFARQVADDFWSRETYGASLERARELAKAEWTPERVRRIAELLLRDPEVDLVFSANPVSRDLEERFAAFTASMVAERRRTSRGFSFNDLLFELDAVLADGERGAKLEAELRKRYGAVLIDEFQDTSSVQYRIFRRIFRDGDKPFFAFGDPKQAIYRFRGGDVFTYLGATADPAARRWSLDVNYRSDEGVVRGVDALFEGAQDPFRSDGRIEFRPASARPEAVGKEALFEGDEPVPPFRVLYAPGETSRDLPAIVASDIATLLAAETFVERVERGEAGGGQRRHRVTARDIAVLTRTNAQLRPIAEALARYGIDTSTAGDASIFGTDEAAWLLKLIDGLAHREDSSRVATGLATPLFGLSAQEVRGVARGEENSDVWAKRMDALARAFERGGFVGLVGSLFALGASEGEPPLLERLFARGVGERIASRLRHLAEAAEAEASAFERDIGEAASWLSRKTAAPGAGGEGEQIRPSTDGDAVLLMTVHKAKGLEFPIVYAPHFSTMSTGGGKWKPIEFHDPDRGNAACADLGTEQEPSRAALAAAEAAGEEMRLFYVAVTRAKHLMKVVWLPPGKRSLPGPADELLRRFGQEKGEEEIDELEDVALERFERSARGAVAVERIGKAGTADAVVPRTGGPKLVFRGVRASIPRCGIEASFTSLAAGDAAFEEEGAEFSSGKETDGKRAEMGAREFPAGRRTGLLFHEIMERTDFPRACREDLAKTVTALLPRRGFDAEEWSPVVVDTVLSAIDAPFGKDDAGLRAIDSSARLDELRFVFPAQKPGTGKEITAEALCEALRACGGDGFGARCAERARDLVFERFSGFVSGAIDLVYARGGKWFIADYKTNRLGPRPEDFGIISLERAMLQHHYYLQYHLYALALHRYLRVRVPGYDYDAGFGGVRYLFLRGMRPGSELGVFAARPARAVVEALDALFAEEGRVTP